ncbi:TlpA family protein disulfide reductase [Psychroserpens luteolus]|uniref:TlpA family protein disulfide reductase n=1 Tax=Psychroserpens luteolus TaxID=2855840 RepID=UPI001E56892F|nr:TlpA disulfide reductase family protein [Psychroserpens luteolus]MCD2258345.1 TlpA family protein disulfide reductase [Psychroserpens luteolus]
MKYLYIALAIALTLFSCQDTKTIKPTTLTIKTNVDTVSVAKVFRPVNGTILWDNILDEFIKNEGDSLSGDLNIEGSEIVRVLVGGKRFRMILFPNQNYGVGFQDDSRVFTGDNAKGQEALNAFDRTYASSFTFLNIFTQDTTATLLSNHISDLKTKDISIIDDLLKTEAIDADFYEVLKTEIDYYYADGLVNIANYKSERAEGKTLRDLKDLIEATKVAFPFTAEQKPINWVDYVMEAEIRPAIVERYNKEDRIQFFKLDTIHHIYKSIIKQQLEEPFREQLLANYILNASRQNQYEKSLIQIFDEFNMNYPESVYSSYLEKDISKIRTYYQKIQGELPKSVTFVEGEQINTLQELLKEFEGEKLYIDVWATWCGPCKREFANNHMIVDILEDNGYKKLFISLDQPEAKDKWIELIKYYDLSGYHHLANREFFIDFEKNHSAVKNGIAIPQYLLIDSNGKIITNTAPRPGDPDAILKLIQDQS